MPFATMPSDRPARRFAGCGTLVASEASGRQDCHHLGAAHLGLGHDPPPARAHDRARRWSLPGWAALDRRQAQLLPARSGALQAVPPPDAAETRCRTRGRQARLLRGACAPGRRQGLRRLPGAAQEDALVRLLQAALRRPEGGAGLPGALHPPLAISNRRLIATDADSVTFKVKDYRVEGPGRTTTMTLATGEFIRRFLLHVLPKGFHRI